MWSPLLLLWLSARVLFDYKSQPFPARAVADSTMEGVQLTLGNRHVILLHRLSPDSA
jgi:hypothetical protein